MGLPYRTARELALGPVREHGGMVEIASILPFTIRCFHGTGVPSINRESPSVNGTTQDPANVCACIELYVSAAHSGRHNDRLLLITGGSSLL